MLPKSKDSPSFGAKPLIHSAVSTAITANLIFPEIGIRGWSYIVQFAPVPKASVDEYSYLLSPKHKIGPNTDNSNADFFSLFYLPMAAPAFDACILEKICQIDFGALVSATFDCRH